MRSKIVRMGLPILAGIIAVISILVVIIIVLPPPLPHFKGIVTYTSSRNSLGLDHTLYNTAYGRFQLIVNASALVNCSILVNRNSTHNGQCSSFFYVYKTKSSSQFDTKAKIEASFHANATNMSVKVQIMAELDPLTQDVGWSMTSQTDNNI